MTIRCSKEGARGGVVLGAASNVKLNNEQHNKKRGGDPRGTAGEITRGQSPGNGGMAKLGAEK